MRKMTRSWKKIQEHYEQGPDEPSVSALESLAQQINNSGLSDGLHAWMSMWTLCIVQIEVSFPYDGPYLMITPVTDRKLEFRYVDSRDPKRQWIREVPPEAAWERLVAFLDQLHWFSDIDKQTQEKQSQGNTK